jgi:amino acid transporter
VLASAIGNAMAAQAAVSRILFAMARDGKLPSILARVHPRYRTPHVSILFVTVLTLGAVGFFIERLDDLTRIVNFGALSSFVLLHLAVIHHYFVRGHSRDWMRHVVFPLIGLTVISYVLIEMDRTAKILGAVWICAGAVYYSILKLLSRKPLSAGI